ncbi:MAG: hypothetical protein JXB48_14410 [Candidatus Latescibacteria bacterium]|nr:hypothetical protein [Candidatus Latescibacterota bacterium]
MGELNSVVFNITKVLWAISWQVSLLVGVIWLISVFSQKASSLFKYWLWSIVLIRLCIPLSLSLSPEFEYKLRGLMSIHKTVITDRTEELSVDNVDGNSMIVAAPQNDAHETAGTAKQIIPNVIVPINMDAIKIYSNILKFPYFIFFIWAIGVITFGVALSVRVFVVNNRFSNIRTIEHTGITNTVQSISDRIGLKQKITLCYLKHAPAFGPAVAGIFKPKLIIPPKMVNEWSSDEIEPIVLHELMHIKRYDLLINYLQMILQVIYFYHPLVWYVNWKIRSINEDVCDDLSLALINNQKKIYTESILNVLMHNIKRPAYQSLSLGFFSKGKKESARRIVRIANSKYRQYSGIQVFSVIMLILIGLFSFSFVGISYPLMKSDLKVIIEGAEVNDGLVKSGMGSFTWEIQDIDTRKYNNDDIYKLNKEGKLSDNPSEYYHYRTSDVFFAFKDTKIRCNQRYREQNPAGEWITRYNQMAFDGEKTDNLYYSSNETNNLIQPRGYIGNNNLIPLSLIDPRYNGLGLLGNSLMSFFQSSQFLQPDLDTPEKVTSIRLIGEELLDNVLCKVLQADLVESDGVITIWIAPDRNYRPKRIELSTKGKIIQVHVVFKKYDRNVWFPDKVTKDSYLIDTDSNEKILEKHSVITIRSDFEINTTVPEDFFELDFPVGLKVYDERIEGVLEITKK